MPFSEGGFCYDVCDLPATAKSSEVDSDDMLC